MSRLDAALLKLPGSVAAKAFTVSVLLCVASAVPIFRKPPEQSRQGHDYMSSEKPEVIRATQERLRKEYRHKRDQDLANAAAGATTTTPADPQQLPKKE